MNLKSIPHYVTIMWYMYNFYIVMVCNSAHACSILKFRNFNADVLYICTYNFIREQLIPKFINII